ncbi:hypothetical protein KFE25_011469 [Diacronema lutheri]|uniref:Uncharacterized protein n=1 Tax=Diacronema lutheri TaxID=2081491 RepID=A0A8J5XAU6_DIALT|nr:hypothetical protein KFE25_011469 [Diacronema lutheri]
MLALLLFLGVCASRALADDCWTLCRLDCNWHQKCIVNYTYCECALDGGKVFATLLPFLAVIGAYYAFRHFCKDNGREGQVNSHQAERDVPVIVEREIISVIVEREVIHQERAAPEVPAVLEPPAQSPSPAKVTSPSKATLAERVRFLRAELDIGADVVAPADVVAHAEAQLKMTPALGASLADRCNAVVDNLGGM